MTTKHRDLDDLTRRLAAPLALAAPGYGAGITLSVVGLRPHVGFALRMRRALARVAAGWSIRHEGARQRCALVELSDYMLCDIGSSRADA